MSPRTLDELRAVLEAEGVDPGLIAIGDFYGRYDTYCIAPCRRAGGALESAGWETFYAERGQARPADLPKRSRSLRVLSLLGQKPGLGMEQGEFVE